MNKLNARSHLTLQIFAFRPLYPHLRTTPLAGARLSTHIKALLLMFGTYIPPATSLSATMNIPAATRSTRVPQDVLTEKVIDEIKTRICFVGEPLDTDSSSNPMSPGPGDDLDLPPSDPAMSESEFSRVSADIDSNFSSHAASSSYSVVSHSQLAGMEHGQSTESGVQALATMYSRHSTATDIHLRVDPPPSQQTGTGRGTLIIPGWIRERAAEVLFEGGDVDESSVAEVVLDTLLKVCYEAPVVITTGLTISSRFQSISGRPLHPQY